MQDPADLSRSVERAPRARDLGLRFGALPTGSWNAITDVPGVAVGHATRSDGERVHTGVTLVFPASGASAFLRKLPAAIAVGNGFGKAAGLSQVEELGTLEAPLALTNTLAVGAVLDALVRRCLAEPELAELRSINVVVGETNDGWLSDIRAMSLGRAEVELAWTNASRGPVEEGGIGAGAGTRCFGWKGGIGTASRVLDGGLGTLGVLVQTNYGGTLGFRGRAFPLRADDERTGGGREEARESASDGSCWIAIATDAPLDARQLGRIARRSFLGLARTGSVLAHGSGDYALAFSTCETNRVTHGAHEPELRRVLPDERLSALFEAVVDATEEAVWNSLVAAREVRGRDGHVAPAIDREAVRRFAAELAR
ncbi:MAG: P1 family peptidase [Planctomycetes bacterium]|nr:P1 family peptidase [Planctomycetota bacterium]